MFPDTRVPFLRPFDKNEQKKEQKEGEPRRATDKKNTAHQEIKSSINAIHRSVSVSLEWESKARPLALG